jgi:hypothetical protein
MLSDSTLDELQSFASRGRIGRVIELHCSDLQPVADSLVTLHWDCLAGDESAVLEISDLGWFPVPSAGNRRVLVGAVPITVRLLFENEAAEALIQPRIVSPHLELRGPNQLVFGETACISWTSNAASSVVRRPGVQGIEERILEPVGSIELVADHLGFLIIEVEARGCHAAISNEAITVRRITVTVVAPPVTLAVDVHEQSASPGDDAIFSWTVTGAQAVRIEALERGIKLQAPLIGHLIVETGFESENFRIVATGMDGIEQARNIRVTTRIPDISQMQCGLNLLAANWE